MFETTYTSLAYFANVPVKGGKNAIVERDENDKFQLTTLAKEWLVDNLIDPTDCEYWSYGDIGQLAFKYDTDRLNFVKWTSSLKKQKGKK